MARAASIRMLREQRPAAPEESSAVSPPAAPESIRLVSPAESGAAEIDILTALYAADRRAAEEEISRAEQAILEHRYEDAIALIDDPNPARSNNPDLVLRALFAESWARMYLGELEPAIALLDHGRAIAEQSWFSDVERADALFRLGCCRYKLSEITTAVSLYTVALELCDRSGRPCDRLRAQILRWRSACYRRQREWDAARADVERALELAEGIGDRRTAADAYVQASLVAERSGDALLARFYAEEARSIYSEFEDRLNVGRLLNNLGGLNFLLGKVDEAVANLKDAYRIASELGSDVDAAQAISSLAQVNLRTGESERAETQARRAIELLICRADMAYELGNAQLVLGRALLEQDRLDEAELAFGAAEATTAALGSDSHRAAAWIAQGDLAKRRGDSDGAAALYRQAAESLQDFRF
jgi:tetratricopeptide (TPR) repeat protein